ncbi:hypothetical protein FHL15_009470 [Xylaria flabelliformis]|uniref:Uncharacterized protein n=1 Tax=Xylaria flabelliformis TaxID=2512241 RepID=A0A553HP62_9PEZI|nr:hypothetical protein FHL15_009470 [Xylaria flabelliformis]
MGDRSPEGKKWSSQFHVNSQLLDLKRPNLVTMNLLSSWTALPTMSVPESLDITQTKAPQRQLNPFTKDVMLFAVTS